MDLTHDIPDEVLQVSEADLRTALAQVVLRSLKPLVAGLAGLYGVYAFGHPVFIEGASGVFLALVAVATAILFAVARLQWHRLSADAPWPHVLGATVAGLVLCNVLLHLYLTDDIAQSTNLILLLMGIGFLSLSTPWYVGMAGGTLAGWGLTVWATLPHDRLMHYGFAVFSAAVLATIVHIARRRSMRIGQRERIAGEQLRAALARSLRAEAQARRALEASNEALEEAVEEAEETNRLQAAFLADMSHEIRTPLTTVIGFSEVLKDEAAGEAKKIAQLIWQSSKRLLETVNSVLDLSKLETGSVQLTPTPVDIGDEVEETARLFQSKARDADVALHVDVPSTLEAEVDTSALHRTCANLVSNAIKYTEPGGAVTVRARGTDDTVVVEVEDTGMGIDPGMHDHLFEPFYQSNDGTLHDEEGTGLGLAITRRLVSLMDGAIEVDSTPGEGSVFTVRVPRWAEG